MDLVFLATQRDGGLEAREYWTTSTILEAACLSGAPQKTVDDALREIMKYEVIEWHQTSTRGTLADIIKLVS